jgi:hypothetical protein
MYRTHIHEKNLHFLHCLPQRKSLFVFLFDEVANDSEDKKRIRAAENRAAKKMKTHKKDTGKENRKRPAEAAESFIQSWTCHTLCSSEQNLNYLEYQHYVRTELGSL